MQNTLLADNGKGVKDNIANGFTSLQLITVSCHSILNTVFVAPDPKPDWFDDLQSKLDNAKKLAKEWIDDLAPELTSSIPTHVINYSSDYSAITDEILAITKKNPTAKGADNPAIQQVTALMKALDESVAGIVKETKDLDTKLKDWGDRMQTAHDDLYNGAVNVQSAMTDLQADIHKMDVHIQGLQATIEKERKGIAGAGAAIGVGLFAVVVGIALAPETGGLSLIGTATGALLIIGGAVTWGVLQHEIDKQLDQIRDDMKEKADDTRQLIALKSIASASGNAISDIETANNKLSDVRTMWNTFSGELQGVVTKLKKGEASLDMIVKEAFCLAAQNEWNDAADFAKKLVGMDIKVENKKMSA